MFSNFYTPFKLISKLYYVSNQSAETNQIKSISIDFSIKQSTIKSSINAIAFFKLITNVHNICTNC
ncbi:hypothetical protein DXD86_00165 [Ruminococcus bromii]|nr:hypothetical protein DXD86_00165 [Ruminococcus bromii]